MKKNKLYIFLSIMIAAVFFIATITCVKGEEPKEKTWKEEVDQSYKDLEKENIVVDEKGPEQPEDVEDSGEQNKSIPITLQGVVYSEAGTVVGSLTITIDKAKNTVGGVVSMGWYQSIEVSEEEDEEHHSHRYICYVNLNDATIFGKIDKKGNINATISGFAYSKAGQDETTNKDASSLCMEEFKNEPVNFPLKGKYKESTKFASGNILPKDWKWWAN